MNEKMNEVTQRGFEQSHTQHLQILIDPVLLVDRLSSRQYFVLFILLQNI